MNMPNKLALMKKQLLIARLVASQSIVDQAPYSTIKPVSISKVMVRSILFLLVIMISTTYDNQDLR